jgi:hypothetical protein
MKHLIAAGAAVLVTLATVWSVANAAYPAVPPTALAAKPHVQCPPG